MKDQYIGKFVDVLFSTITIASNASLHLKESA